MRAYHWRGWVGGLCLAAAGCVDPTPNEAPAPAPAAPPAPAPTPEPEPEPFVIHTVEEGETLWDIARSYETTVEQIQEANRKDARRVRMLSKGTELRIPGATAAVEVLTAADRATAREELPKLEDGAYHFLQSGESLWTLARLYDIDMETIMTRNELTDEKVGMLRIGAPVIIPGVKAAKIKQAEPAKRLGLTHEMSKGETIWDLAHAFQVSVREIMTANALSEADVTRLRDGRRIFIPGVEDAGGGRLRRKTSARERRASAVARRLGLGTRQVATRLLAGKVERRWIQAAGGSRKLAGTLRWPVAKGWFVRGYGSGEGGYHMAVDIMGKIGWNVRSAAPGIVAYAGNEVRGYGNMVLVIHPGGWVTMYAHNSVNFAAAGEKVPKGAILAEVGSTGISRGPHVHFELIHSGKNCDPASLFRPGIRHRSGKMSSTRKSVWKDPGSRPAAVKCGPRRRHPRSRWVIHEDPRAEPDQ